MRELSISRMLGGLLTAFCMTLSTWMSPAQLLAANYGSFYDVNGNAYSLQPNYSTQNQASYNQQQLMAAQAIVQHHQMSQASMARQQLAYSCIPQPECCEEDYGYYEPYYAPCQVPCAESCSPCCILIAAAIIGALCGLAAGCCCSKHGRKGDQGETGPQGPQGLTGAQGPQGLSGYPGLPGLPGVAGQPGVAGVAGLAGLPGTPGVAGEPGVAGVAGTPGVAGVAGTPGVAGLAGVAGVAGAPGVAGLAGVAGVAGQPGNNGNNGDPGVAGVAGAPGVAGVAGAPGTAGIAGVAGQPGNNGNNGNNGADGASCCGSSTTLAGQTPVESVFRFESTMAPPGVNGTFRGVVITPDNQVYTTAPMTVGCMGIQSETLTVKALAGQGSYRVVFMADEHTPQGSTLGSVEVSSNHGSQMLSFAPSRLISSAGDQVSFDFTLQP